MSRYFSVFLLVLSMVIFCGFGAGLGQKAKKAAGSKSGESQGVADKNYDTTLIRAIIKGKVKKVNIALQSVVDIEAKSKDGDTALTVALDKGNAKIVRAILEKGADINAKNKAGNTPPYCSLL